MLFGQTFKVTKRLHSSFLYMEYMYGMNTQRPLNLHPLLSFPLEDLSYLEVKMLKKSTCTLNLRKPTFLMKKNNAISIWGYRIVQSLLPLSNCKEYVQTILKRWLTSHRMTQNVESVSRVTRPLAIL